MERKAAQAGSGTSMLVSGGALAAWAVGVLLCLQFSLLPAAALFLGFLILGLILRFWGERAIRHVSLSVSCPRPHIFPGQTLSLSYTLTNDKILPLLWLDLTQNGPETDCFQPDPAFEAYHEAGTASETPASLRQTFSFIGSYQSLTLESHWQGVHRGIYRIEHLAACSGDGFGLVQREQSLPAGQMPTLAVYPRPVEVDLSPFLTNQWDCDTGRHGFLEDNTILRGNREYMPGDNWKAINWRMAAREQGLPVNLYETIRPRAIRFILDGESFCTDKRPASEISPSGDGEEDTASSEENAALLEEALEILASLLTGLSDRQMSLSLSLPRSRRFRPMTLNAAPGDGVSDLLFHLAGYDCAETPVSEEAQEAGASPFLPSVFPEDVIPTEGSVWIITRSGRSLPANLLTRLRPAQAHLVCAQDWELAARTGFAALPLESLRKGGSQ
ncbi:MAG: DUF58 domain-containing protein [Lachnospiraceae bacterium]|nr:DUF58 domain-containing protein [Lachnospiraceae bacterium]